MKVVYYNIYNSSADQIQYSSIKEYFIYIFFSELMKQTNWRKIFKHKLKDAEKSINIINDEVCCKHGNSIF